MTPLRISLAATARYEMIEPRDRTIRSLRGTVTRLRRQLAAARGKAAK